MALLLTSMHTQWDQGGVGTWEREGQNSPYMVWLIFCEAVQLQSSRALRNRVQSTHVHQHIIMSPLKRLVTAYYTKEYNNMNIKCTRYVYHLHETAPPIHVPPICVPSDTFSANPAPCCLSLATCVHVYMFIRDQLPLGCLHRHTCTTKLDSWYPLADF